jgi:hypothetical protein
VALPERARRAAAVTALPDRVGSVVRPAPFCPRVVV